MLSVTIPIRHEQLFSRSATVFDLRPVIQIYKNSWRLWGNYMCLIYKSWGPGHPHNYSLGLHKRLKLDNCMILTWHCRSETDRSVRCKLRVAEIRVGVMLSRSPIDMIDGVKCCRWIKQRKSTNLPLYSYMAPMKSSWMQTTLCPGKRNSYRYR